MAGATKKPLPAEPWIPPPGAASAAGSGRVEVETDLEASRAGVERRRALRRAARRRVAGETPSDGYLERSTASATVARQHRLSEASFVEWAAEANRCAGPASPAAVDLSLSAYFDYLYLGGCEPWEGRQALHGFAHVHRFPRPKDTFPHAVKALAGWLKRAPESSRDPCPWEALALLATWFIGLGNLAGALAAACAVVQFGVYGRPSATLAPTLDHIVSGSSAANRRYNQLAVIVAPSGLGRKPAKNQHYDDTVIVGGMSPERAWIRTALERLMARAKRLKLSSLFAGLDLPTYEALFRRGSQ
ncbi:unnamed protein product, partial [Prorocentrum cordatum]